MSNTTFQLLAVDHNDKVVQVVSEDTDCTFLDRVVEARDGITWIGSEPCSLKVVRK